MPFDATRAETGIDPAIEHLLRIRTALEKRHGWVQGTFTRGEAHCLLGWVWKTYQPHQTFALMTHEAIRRSEATYWLHEALPPKHRSTGALSMRECDLQLYNDRFRTRRKDVVKLVDRAIELAKWQREQVHAV